MCDHKYDKKIEKIDGEWVSICTKCGKIIRIEEEDNKNGR